MKEYLRLYNLFLGLVLLFGGFFGVLFVNVFVNDLLEASVGGFGMTMTKSFLWMVAFYVGPRLLHHPEVPIFGDDKALGLLELVGFIGVAFFFYEGVQVAGNMGGFGWVVTIVMADIAIGNFFYHWFPSLNA